MIATIKQHLDCAALIGWRIRPRVGLTIKAGRAILRIQYRSDIGLWPIEAGDPEDGVEVNMTDMPAGVSVLGWSAPPDDLIELPKVLRRSDITQIASALNRKVAHRLVRADGAIIYWLDPED